MSKTKPAKKSAEPKSAAKRPALLARLEEVDLKRIHASPTNPRKTISTGELAELTASVKEQGILQALLLRPHPKKKGEHELVCGERRWRAASAAGLKTVPATIRDLTDDQVIVAQLTENAQRADVHPLEEADAYGQLMEKHGHTVDDLVAEVGKSKGHIYSRLKLCALGPVGRKAFLDGRMTIGTAVFLARVSNAKLQEQAAAAIAKGYGKDQPWGTDQACHYVQQHCMLVLKDAPFDASDATLVPAAGACGACPKRTGNQGELFAEVEHDDLCTDPGCFEQKKEAGWKKKVDEAQSKGHRVLSPKEAKETFKDRYSAPVGYQDLDARNHQDPKGRTLRQLIGKQLKDTPIVVAKNPHTEEVVDLLPKKDVNRLLKAAGHDPKKEKEQRQAVSPVRKKEQEAFEAGRRGIQLAVAELVAKAEAAPTDRTFLQLLVEEYIEMDGGDAALERRGFDREDLWGEKLVEKVREWMASMTEAQLRGLVFEMAIDRRIPNMPNPEAHNRPAFDALCELYGVDLNACLDHAKTEPPPAPPQHPALAVSCAVCRAEVGAGCTNTEGKRGKPLDAPHVERSKKAEREAAEKKPAAIPTCRVCGCDEAHACTDDNGDACSWSEPDLCSACA
jgi:ParB/RepB/Spo0J family partition protein